MYAETNKDLIVIVYYLYRVPRKGYGTLINRRLIFLGVAVRLSRVPTDVICRCADDAVAFAPGSPFYGEYKAMRDVHICLLRSNESRTDTRINFYCSDMFVLPILRRTFYFISYRLPRTEL